MDPTCERAMAIVRQRLPLDEATAGNVEEAARIVAEECEREGRDGDAEMTQCAFYVGEAARTNPELLLTAWPAAFSDTGKACGRVVTWVNEHMRGLEDVVVQRDEGSGREAFVRVPSAARRLAGAASTAAAISAGVGVFLAHVCRSFNPETFEVLLE